MGLIDRVMGLLFGSGRNVVAETAEVFRVNAEAQDARAVGLHGAALAQFGAEFARARRSRFDRVMDGSTACRARRWRSARWGCS